MLTNREPTAPCDAEMEKPGGWRMLVMLLAAAAGMLFLAGLGAGVHSLWPAGQALGSHEMQEETVKRVPVVLTAAKDMTFESTVVVSGPRQRNPQAVVRSTGNAFEAGRRDGPTRGGAFGA